MTQQLTAWHEKLLDACVQSPAAVPASVAAAPDSVARERNEIEQLCDEIQHLAFSALGPQKFISRFIRTTARIYRARQVAIWLMDQAKGRPALWAVGDSVQSGWSEEGAGEALVDAALGESIEHCFRAGVAGVHRLATGDRTRRPSGERLVLTRALVDRGNQAVGVLSIDLGSGRLDDDDTLTGYLSVAKNLCECLLGYLQTRQRRAERQWPSFAEAARALQSTSDLVVSRHEAIRRMIEQNLGRLAGVRFETLQENREFAIRVHELLDANGLRARCPECGEAAILRCLNTGNSKTGVFSFDHYIDGRRRYHRGATCFPKLKICDKPSRRQRSDHRCV